MSNLIVNGVVQHPPTIQTDQSAVNTLGTTYQNTGLTPMFVSVSIRSTTSIGLIMRTDSASPPLTPCDHVTVVGNTDDSVQGWVLPGNYYRIFNATGGGTQTINEWMEWT